MEIKVTFKFKLINTNDVSPLQDIEAIFLLDYENNDNQQKRTIRNVVDGLVTGTPTINYLMSEPNTTTVRPGQKMDFTIEIFLVKMRSPLEIEVTCAYTLFISFCSNEFCRFHNPFEKLKFIRLHKQ